MDFNYERPTFDLDGVTFQFKKSSPKNAEKVFEYYQDLVDRFGGNIEDVEDGEVEMEDFEQENINSMQEMVRLIADPTEYTSPDAAFKEIEWDEVDQKKVQAAMNYFLG